MDTWAGNNYDPITLHKYLYAGADPGNMIDPSGNAFTMSGVMSAINVVGTLTNIATTTYDVFQFATGEGDMSAFELGLVIIASKLPVKTTQRLFKKLCSPNSFSGETLVSTEHGLVSIKDIEIGDRVWSYSEETSEVSLQEVTHLIEGGGDKNLVDVTLGHGDLVRATSGHPFYIPIIGEWVDADSLVLSNRLLDQNGVYVEVEKLTKLTKIIKVYNLTIANNHNYFVGESKVLSHNSGACDIGGELVKLGKLKVLKTSYLKKQGIDAHAAKALMTGTNKKNAQFDMLIDKNSKKVFLKAKDGTLIESTYSFEELKRLAPLTK